ncbi:MAG: hypothetical protein OXL38_10000 [Gammaproteobacteria bacterium]|nr:hypothetical protein [Gammaproteobacteria bacterium]
MPGWRTWFASLGFEDFDAWQAAQPILAGDSSLLREWIATE